MSVIVMMKFDAPAGKLEEMVAGEHGKTLERIGAQGRSMGAIHHAFVEDTDGKLLVIDEWESEEAFRRFFEQQQDIPRVMADAGVREQPSTTTYRILSTPDQF